MAASAPELNLAGTHSGGPRAVVERAWRSWPRLVWFSARLTARIYICNGAMWVNVRSLLPRTERPARITMAPAATFITFPRKRDARRFTRHLRGNVHLPADSAGTSCQVDM